MGERTFKNLGKSIQELKLLEHVLDTFLRDIVDTESMQFGFVPERGTADAVISQLQQKFITADKPLYLAFVDMDTHRDTMYHT